MTFLKRGFGLGGLDQNLGRMYPWVLISKLWERQPPSPAFSEQMKGEIRPGA